MATLSLENVRKIFGSDPHSGVRAVDDISMRIEKGEIVGLLGSSGCGKTSTLRMIAGLESVTRGDIKIGERVIQGLPAAQRNVAMAFEGYALYPPLKVRDNIAFGLLRDKRPKAEIDAKVETLAQLLEIEDILERYPPTLSGGQQQRVSLARALARNADVYLLDEPMSQLEPQLRAILRARIKDYLIKNSMTTVFVTHDQTEAIALADRIAVMEAGQLKQFGAPDELRDRPENLFVASFIGEPPMNIFRATVESADGKSRLTVRDDAERESFSLTLSDSALRSVTRKAQQREIFLGIRPNAVRIGPVVPDNEMVMTVSGKVVSNQWLGDQTHVGVDVNGSFLISVSDGDIEAPIDSTVSASLPASALHVFETDSEQAVLHGIEAATDESVRS